MTIAHFTDNYTVERKAAGQIEAEWSDVLLENFITRDNPAAARLGSGFLVRPTYRHAVADWLSSALADTPNPRRVVDVGAGLGRFLVELVRRCPEVESALYVEPSPTLFKWAERIFSDGSEAPVQIPVVKGLGEVTWHEATASARLEASVRKKIRLVPGSVDARQLEGVRFDLVTALNVLDACAYPSRLAADILNLVAPSGHVALSCTHQFQPRFYIDESTVFDSLHDLFPDHTWKLVTETELSFDFRLGDRVRQQFLSHHVLYQKRSDTI
jgi:SAM-dependent methyltransferase